MSQPFQVHSEVAEVGKRLKASKKRFYWRFGIGGSKHECLLIHSLMSGKKQVFVDGQQVHASQNQKRDFGFQFQCGGSLCVISASESGPHELRIDGALFNNLPYESAVPMGSPQIREEKKRAEKVFHDLDADAELAHRLQEEERRSLEADQGKESDDMKMARALQEQYDREHQEHQEYLRKSGVSTAESGASRMSEPQSEVNLLSFTEDDNISSTYAQQSGVTASIFEAGNSQMPKPDPQPQEDLLNFSQNTEANSGNHESNFSDVDFNSSAAPPSQPAPVFDQFVSNNPFDSQSAIDLLEPETIKKPIGMEPPKGMLPPVVNGNLAALSSLDLDIMSLSSPPPVPNAAQATTAAPAAPPGKGKSSLSFEQIDPLASLPKKQVAGGFNTSRDDESYSTMNMQAMNSMGVDNVHGTGAGMAPGKSIQLDTGTNKDTFQFGI